MAWRGKARHGEAMQSRAILGSPFSFGERDVTSMVELHDGGIFDMLDKLPAEIHSKAIRPAAQAGAQVLYDEVRMRVPQSAEGVAHMFKNKSGGRYLYYSGDLKKAIYQKHSPESSVNGAHVYHVSWRKTGPGAVPYGYMVEYGTAKWKGKPFLRPAYEAKKQAALDAADKVLGEKLNEVLNGL